MSRDWDSPVPYRRDLGGMWIIVTLGSFGEENSMLAVHPAKEVLSHSRSIGISSVE